MAWELLSHFGHDVKIGKMVIHNSAQEMATTAPFQTIIINI